MRIARLQRRTKAIDRREWLNPRIKAYYAYYLGMHAGLIWATDIWTKSCWSTCTPVRVDGR